MMGINRLLVVGALAVVGFVVAIFAFKEVPFSECTAEAAPNPAVNIALEPTPPTVDLMMYRLKVTENGQPVSGARVCLRADMGGAGNMSGMGTTAEAREMKPGEYHIMIRFEMSGHWDVYGLVQKPGQDPVAVKFGVEAE